MTDGLKLESRLKVGRVPAYNGKQYGKLTISSYKLFPYVGKLVKVKVIVENVSERFGYNPNDEFFEDNELDKLIQEAYAEIVYSLCEMDNQELIELATESYYSKVAPWQ